MLFGGGINTARISNNMNITFIYAWFMRTEVTIPSIYLVWFYFISQQIITTTTNCNTS